MANNLTAIMGLILARSLPVLRHHAYMLRLVNTDYSQEAAQKGQVINVEVPTDAVATDVTPSNTPPAATEYSAATVPVRLTNWKHSDFKLTDNEIHEIDSRSEYLPRRVESAVKAIAYAMNASVWTAAYQRTFGRVGTAGTALFNSSDADARNVRRVLNEQLCPPDDRRFVLDFTAGAAALGLPSFANFEQSGDRDVKIKGFIGRKFGLDFFEDDQVPTHTCGTGSGYLVNDAGGMAIGEYIVTVDTGSGTILKGDIVTFAGHTQTYAVVSALSSNQFQIYPPLVAAVADNAAITVLHASSSYKVNLAFNRDAIALAVRPLEEVRSLAGAELLNTMTMVDDLTGIPLRLEVMRQYKQIVWDLDVLWGVENVRPELACRAIA